ncbi:hypothetical protein [uncultured Bacteroides sp.]|uniref:hypothetical protein n=1 Tax=uncultured Bacteroides sp. TaxID=162156 RepID=UPI00262CC772|nr:hypothetical protein [uncultured Bacteroides sp.]
MSEFEYKDEIISSRVGFLGGSDANILSKVSSLGSVPESAKERLAIVKGIKQPKDGFTSEAMRIGDTVECLIYDMLKSQDSRWVSNPRIESKKYKFKNVGLLVHIDYMLVDEDNKILTWVENKCTNKDIKASRKTYQNQLFIESILGKEYAESLGNGWKFKLMLSHYPSADFDGVLDPSKIETETIRFNKPLFNVSQAMSIIDKYLETIEEYVERDIVPMESAMLPEPIQDKIALCRELWDFQKTELYAKVKEMEKAEEELRSYLYDVMIKKNITEKIELVDLGKYIKLKQSYEKVSFDTNAFKQEHKNLYKKYSKKSTVKGNCIIGDLKN